MSGIAGPDRRLRRACSRAIAPLVAVLVVAACSGGDDPDADATTLAPPTTPTPTTAASTTVPPTATLPTTSAPPTTTAPATTPPPTSAPQTTAVPTTPPASPEAIVAAALESWRLLNEVRLDPLNDDKAALLRNVRTGAALDFAFEVVSMYRAENTRSITNATTPASASPFIETLVIAADGAAATLEYCVTNSNIYVETGGNPDGTDRVINDDVTADRYLVSMVNVDGVWLESDASTLAVYEGVASCPE
jgi:hypothetical protein